MFIKQIDMKTALELAARGKEVLVMYPETQEEADWKDMRHDTLANMLAGVMFFRREPALETDVIGDMLPDAKRNRRRKWSRNGSFQVTRKSR